MKWSKWFLRILGGIILSPLILPFAIIAGLLLFVGALISLFAMLADFVFSGRWEWNWIWEDIE